MTKDLNKNISSIQYNSLNLPSKVVFSDGKYMDYVYSATGEKRSVTYNVLSSNGSYTYCDNFIYYNGDLNKILVDGGYISISGTTPTYHYYLKDHLGNNRVVVDASGTVKQVTHYYPFGGFFGESTGSSYQTYKYNGKEFERLISEDWYDYGARHMDGMRFTTIDPMAEKYYDISPYVYCGNNPVNAVDPDGSVIRPTLYRYVNGRGHAVGSYYRSSKKYYDAMTQFSQTAYGKELIGKFLKKGTVQYGVKGTGEYSNYLLSIEQYNFNNNTDMFMYMGGKAGSFKAYEENGNLVILISLDVRNQSIDELLVTLTHELALHGSKIDDIIKAYTDGGIEAVKVLTKKDLHGNQEHKALYKKDKSLLGVRNYLRTMNELYEMNHQLVERFEEDINNYSNGN